MGETNYEEQETQISIDYAGGIISRKKKCSELRDTGLKTLNELAEAPIRDIH